MILITTNEPYEEQFLDVDGERFRVVRVLSWTGTVAQLEIEPAPLQKDHVT